MKRKGSVLTQFSAEELCEGSSVWLNQARGPGRTSEVDDLLTRALAGRAWAVLVSSAAHCAFPFVQINRPVLLPSQPHRASFPSSRLQRSPP